MRARPRRRLSSAMLCGVVQGQGQGLVEAPPSPAPVACSPTGTQIPPPGRKVGGAHKRPGLPSLGGVGAAGVGRADGVRAWRKQQTRCQAIAMRAPQPSRWQLLQCIAPLSPLSHSNANPKSISRMRGGGCDCGGVSPLGSRCSGGARSPGAAGAASTGGLGSKPSGTWQGVVSGGGVVRVGRGEGGGGGQRSVAPKQPLPSPTLATHHEIGRLDVVVDELCSNKGRGRAEESKGFLKTRNGGAVVSCSKRTSPLSLALPSPPLPYAHPVAVQPLHRRQHAARVGRKVVDHRGAALLVEGVQAWAKQRQGHP